MYFSEYNLQEDLGRRGQTVEVLQVILPGPVPLPSSRAALTHEDTLLPGQAYPLLQEETTGTTRNNREKQTSRDLQKLQANIS